MKSLRNPAFYQLIRYGIVGILNNIFLYIGYLLITYAGGNEKIAMTTMYATGVVIGYIASYRWTFSQASNRRALFRYVQMHVSGYLINLFMLYSLVDLLGYPHQLVQVAAIIVVALFGFFTCKYYVFQQTSS